MGACRTCGESAGLLSRECENCLLERQKKERSEAAARSAEEERERKAIIESEVKRITEDTNQGFSCYLHRSYYVTVPSQVIGSDWSVYAYDDTEVRLAGLEGWKVVGVVPHTSGMVLTNKDGFNSIWAGGSGGNVVGVYVLMELEINSNNVSKLESEILEYLEETIR
jgi:hypothetical protein